MSKFKVSWSKAYYINGEVTVEADTAEQAEQIVDAEIGDYEGSLNYYPDDNVIDVEELD